MADFDFGPIEMLMVGFAGDRPSGGVVEAIADLIGDGLVRLLDLTFVSHSLDGVVTVQEIDDVSDEYGLGDIVLESRGIAADEDIADFALDIPRGSSAALLVIELVWAKHLASKLAQADGAVLTFARIPAPIVNSALAAIAQ